jgi:Zn-dependent protease
MIEQLYILPILLFSVVIHEIAHGFVALLLGDPTAKEMGRLTLNPIPHIDMVGSILVPLSSLLLAGSVFIAWAKPVPVNPMNFSRYRRDDVLVTIAGPLSNILVAMLCTLAVIGLGHAGGAITALGLPLADAALEFSLKMFYGGVYLNIVLAVFNLIPVPPLDGSHVLASLLPERLAARYRSIGFLGIFVILFLMRVPAFNSAFHAVISAGIAPFQSMIRLFL